MKKTILFFIFFLQIGILSAQFPIGHRTISCVDPIRTRTISNEIYYPAVTAGESTTTANGQFPVIVFGHGFMMTYDAYLYFKDAIVPLGYIVAFPTTEGSASPSHSDFGKDLAFVLNYLISEGTNNVSPFYNHIAITSAIMGHSMGGGASFLACENNAVPTCMLTFAAANTTPSSIIAAHNIPTPSLVLSGAVDCVAPPLQHQIPMYDSLASACKVYVSINNGGHCYFGDYNFLCTFGESSCMPVIPITRPAQQDVILDFVKLYLDYYLKGNTSSWTIFNDSLSASARITFEKNCPSVGVENEFSSIQIKVFPNPATDEILVIAQFASSEENIVVTIQNTLGQTVFSYSEKLFTTNFRKSFSLTNLKQGVYFLHLKSSDNSVVTKFIKN